MESGNNLERLGLDIKDYAQLQAEKYRLKASASIAQALSRALAWFLVIAVLAIVLGLLAFALLQTLNSLLGAPWGTLVVLGIFLVLLLVLYCLRESLFHGTFVNILAGEDADAVRSDLVSIDGKIASQEKKLRRSYQRTRNGFTLGGLLSGFLRGGASRLGFAETAYAVFRFLTKKKR